MTFARLLDSSKDSYHADPCDVPSLNQSIAKVLVTESPLHAWYLHPKLGGGRRESTEAMNKGTIIHKLLLGVGTDIVVIQADDFRTKAAQEARDAAIAAGKAPIIARKFEELTSTVNALRGRLADAGIDLSTAGALHEQGIEWDEETPDGPVRCRGMLDYLNPLTAQILDPKTTEDAHPDAVQRAMINMGYDIQEAGYTSAVEKLFPDLVGRVDFGFLFLELAPPYGILPVRSSPAMREHGRSRWNRAVRIWQKCLTSGMWPGYSQGWATISPSNWALTAELGVQE